MRKSYLALTVHSTFFLILMAFSRLGARSFRVVSLHRRKSLLLQPPYGSSQGLTYVDRESRISLRSSVSSTPGREDEAEVLMQAEDFSVLPEGSPKGFFVVKQYPTPSQFDWSGMNISDSDVLRLGLTPNNISLPIALMMLDPVDYPSMSRARKVCRKGNILLHRGPLETDPESGEVEFRAERSIRGRVGDRVSVGDVVAKQVRMGSGYFPVLSYKKPPFDVPVLYEDDHMALVNKPSGVVVYNQRNGGHGIMTIRAALPFVLKPPRLGTYSVMRRPASVHRLDKPTSGILCVAKTKPAMIAMSKQFHDRVVKKTYMAVVNGLPFCDRTISSREAYDLGVDVDPEEPGVWNLVDYSLDEKPAVTVWRPIRYVQSLHANDEYITLVELKPKTGRYHQLRRHMAWACDRPIVGDDEYDGGTPSAMKFRDRGLFLCSTKIKLQHPHYNTPSGRHEWEHIKEREELVDGLLYATSENDVMISANVDLPSKFESLLQREEERFGKFRT